MDILNIIVGLFMIGIGFLVKSTPSLIAGYNTMSDDKKKNVDIVGLTTYMRNSLIIIGLSIIAGYYLFKWIGFEVIAESMILIVTLIGVLIMVINDSTRESFYQSQKIFAGNVLIFLPFVMAIRQVFNLGLDAVTIFGLYIRFFRHELNKEDYGRIIGFYMTLIINLTGIFCIINGLME
jgi:uncharacterized membrane protein